MSAPGKRRCESCGRLKPRSSYERATSDVCKLCVRSRRGRRTMTRDSSYLAWLVDVIESVGFDRLGRLKQKVVYPMCREAGKNAGRAWGPEDDRSNQAMYAE